MTIFESVIPFPKRLQWLMLKAALDQECNAHMIASRLGWSVAKVMQTVWGNPGKFRIDRIAEWFFACGGAMPRFSIVDDPWRSA
ncbi:hypothetical protein [Rhizobium freirei]|uniref:hypothetical protein n=1 Tax=Rhizobium freirei TaxID=1353277 RepID=UPI00055E6F09|nr:hypothetical protein [Rhizobium freirei]